MLPATIRRRLTLAVMSLLFLMMLVPLNILPDTAFAQATTVAVDQVWTADGNNITKTSFVPGDTIHYMVKVTNSGSSTVTATFTFLATGPEQIFSLTTNAPVAANTEYFYSPSTVPVNALKGTYTITVTVTYNGQSSTKENSFTIQPTLQAAYSQVWSGYVVEGTTASPVTYTDVKASWTIPTAKCSKGETSRSATWVGIGGIEGDTYLEQIGTTANCNNGTPNYYEWYEMVGSPNPNPVQINCVNPLKAGDTVYLAEVVYEGDNHFSFELDTSECDFGTVQIGYAGELNSAEWIVEDPPDAACTTQCPLTQFVTGNKPLINFSHGYFNGNPNTNGNPITANPLLRSFAITDNGQANGTLKAFPLHTTSGDTAFSVEWVQS
jgi:hypothetical protein